MSGCPRLGGGVEGSVGGVCGGVGTEGRKETSTNSMHWSSGEGVGTREDETTAETEGVGLMGGVSGEVGVTDSEKYVDIALKQKESHLTLYQPKGTT